MYFDCFQLDDQVDFTHPFIVLFIFFLYIHIILYLLYMLSMCLINESFIYHLSFMIASINAISCPIGGLLCSYVLDKYGRKKTLYTINMLSVISWGMMAMASSVDKELMFIQLLVARFIIGICIGLSSAPSAVYSAEIAHPTLRGRFSVITSVTIGLGILFIYVLGYFIPVRFQSIFIQKHEFFKN